MPTSVLWPWRIVRATLDVDLYGPSLLRPQLKDLVGHIVGTALDELGYETHSVPWRAEQDCVREAVYTHHVGIPPSSRALQTFRTFALRQKSVFSVYWNKEAEMYIGISIGAFQAAASDFNAQSRVLSVLN